MLAGLTNRSSFELVAHTADLGLRVAAASLNELFLTGAQGLYAAIGDLEYMDGSDQVQLDLDLQEPGLPELFRAFLAELLFYFDSRRLLLLRLDTAELSHGRLLGKIALGPCDFVRSTLLREVKAITYHRLSVEDEDKGDKKLYRAFVIFDI